MELNELRDDNFALATKQGFHGIDENGINQDDLSRKLMLVVSELVEAQEAERKGVSVWRKDVDTPIPTSDEFKKSYRGTIEEEIADAVIRLADIAGMIGMNLDWWVSAKMEYNRQRPYKHGKEY